ncbi:hypothetical protein QTO34_014352 [Cnephaeus nilssonii]|uniref:DNA helicase n=1 Tax=Cnephaeus nilssonii TaxID=3371016 RepID=A0AA40LU83_CNENI|nr:hypothetical protein QTO34_014352 [Eptesicus nilssonii]
MPPARSKPRWGTRQLAGGSALHRQLDPSRYHRPGRQHGTAPDATGWIQAKMGDQAGGGEQRPTLPVGSKPRRPGQPLPKPAMGRAEQESWQFRGHCSLWSPSFGIPAVETDNRMLSLKTNMRSEDSAYSEWLVKLGRCKLDSSFHLGMDIIEIPHEMIHNGSIIEATFGNSISIDNIKNISKCEIRPKNEHVQKLNEEILDILDGDFHTYLSDDSIDSTDDAEKENFPIEFLNSITP